jgi:hypothetical protein
MRTCSWLVMVFGLVVVMGDARAAQAQIGTAARETAEFVIQRWGKTAAREGIEVLARRIETLAVRHGEKEVLLAVRKVGPRFFQVVEHAGEHAGKAVGIMAKHGEPGVAWILSRPKGMGLFLQHGEEAASALVKHAGGIAEPLIEQAGMPAIKALHAVGPQSGRRLAMLMSEGELARLGRTPQLLDVIARYGERACTFVWENKVTLAGVAAMTAFLANPEPFINGTRDITKIVAETAVKPMAEASGEVAREAARSINWTLIIVICLVLAAMAVIAIIVILLRLRKFIAN